MPFRKGFENYTHHMYRNKCSLDVKRSFNWSEFEICIGFGRVFSLPIADNSSFVPQESMFPSVVTSFVHSLVGKSLTCERHLQIGCGIRVVTENVWCQTGGAMWPMDVGNIPFAFAFVFDLCSCTVSVIGGIFSSSARHSNQEFNWKEIYRLVISHSTFPLR